MPGIRKTNTSSPQIILKQSAMTIAYYFPASGASAQVFDSEDPDVDKGRCEFEILTGVTLSNVESGGERSAHEISVGFSPLSWWKTMAALRITNPAGENAEIDAYEWENIFLAPVGTGRAKGNTHGAAGLNALGLYVALEVPDDGGFSRGEIAIGPIADFALGPVTTIANLFVFSSLLQAGRTLASPTSSARLSPSLGSNTSRSAPA